MPSITTASFSLDTLNQIESLWQADSCFSGKILTEKKELQSNLRQIQSTMKVTKIALATLFISSVFSVAFMASISFSCPPLLLFTVLGGAASLAITHDLFIWTKAVSTVEKVCGEFADTIQSAPSDHSRYTSMAQRFRWSNQFDNVKKQMRSNFLLG